MTAVWKIYVLGDIINKYNITVHRSIKVKPIDVTSDSYAEYNKDSNVAKPKFKIGDHVRISKCKNIFAKGYTQNWAEEVFVVSKLRIQSCGHMWLVTWMVNQLLEVLMKNNCKKLVKEI